jgi:peroxiredoxin
MSQLVVNKPAPDFTTVDYLDKEFKLSDYKGKENIFLVLNRGFI